MPEDEIQARPFTIQPDGMLAVRWPIPPEDQLLNMLFEAQANGRPVGFCVQITIELRIEDIQEMLRLGKTTGSLWVDGTAPR
jgi:hypothetical protein